MVRKADKKIKDFVKKVRKDFPLEKAIFFGSRVRGDNFKFSDYDVILVSKKFSGIFFTERMAKMYQYWDNPLVLEAFCYTPEEFAVKKKQIGFVQQAIKEGIEV